MIAKNAIDELALSIMLPPSDHIMNVYTIVIPMAMKM
jgi:hypothetical protein